MGSIVRLSDLRRKAKPTFFTRPELNLLLSLYSRQVARGLWRDYAIGLQDGKALFAVFRHADESALYTIVKSAPTGDRKGEYTLLSGRLPLARAATFSEILGALRARLQPNAVALDSEGGR